MNDLRKGGVLLLVLGMLLAGCGQQGDDQKLSTSDRSVAAPSTDATNKNSDTTDNDDDQDIQPNKDQDKQPNNSTGASNKDTDAPHEPEVSEGLSEDEEANSGSEPTSEKGPEESSSGDEPRQETKVVELPYREPDDDGYMPSAMLRGTLAADREVDGGCAWVVREDDSAIAVLWNKPYRMRFPADGGPAEMLDDAGTTVAREGDVVQLSGGSVDDWGPLERCHVGDQNHVWWGAM